MAQIQECLEDRRIEARSKIWLESHGEVIFGGGRTALLEAIDETGSILQATKKLGISYRGAWGKINATEERLGIKLLERFPGGRGGGAKLTPEAKELVKVYRQFKKDCIIAVDRLFHQHFEKVINK